MTGSAARTKPAYPIGSVDKALRLILMLSAADSNGMRIQDASAALGVAPSTAHRLLQMLTQYGFAVQNPQTKLYLAGPAVQGGARSRAKLVEESRPILASLVERFQETVHLAALERGLAVTLVSVESPLLLRVGDRSGRSQLAARSAMGNALLLDHDETQLSTLFDQLGPDVASGEIQVPELMARLRLARAVGYSHQDGVVEAGVSAIAVPVRGRLGSIEFAIGFTYPTPRVDIARIPDIVRAMHEAAAELSAALTF